MGMSISCLYLNAVCKAIIPGYFVISASVFVLYYLWFYIDLRWSVAHQSEHDTAGCLLKDIQV